MGQPLTIFKHEDGDWLYLFAVSGGKDENTVLDTTTTRWLSHDCVLHVIGSRDIYSRTPTGGTMNGKCCRCGKALDGQWLGFSHHRFCSVKCIRWFKIRGFIRRYIKFW